jgi:predicted DNA-binding transcriptional regulator AlpA
MLLALAATSIWAERGKSVRNRAKILIDELPDRMLNTASVLDLTGFSRAQLYIAMADDQRFPMPVKLHRTKNAWFLSEVMEWLKARPRAKAFKKPPLRKGTGNASVEAMRRAQLDKEAAGAVVA